MADELDFMKGKLTELDGSTDAVHEPLYSVIDSLDNFYGALGGKDPATATALLMLKLRSWLNNATNFDPVTGYALDTDIVAFIEKIKPSGEEFSSNDRISRIVEHIRDAVVAIMEQTRHNIIREHAMLPLHAAREVDSISVQWLSRKSGRTLREKLSGKPFIKAVNRRSSVDTSENRLFKALLMFLEETLNLIQRSLSYDMDSVCDDLLTFIQRWKNTEDFEDIGTWTNLPPNNILLQDKRYRKIWDAWNWLQSIDENIKQDNIRVQHDLLNFIFWRMTSSLINSGRLRIIQQPVTIDDDGFGIAPEIAIQGYVYLEVKPKQDTKIKNFNFLDIGRIFGSSLQNDLLKHIELSVDHEKIHLKIANDSYEIKIDQFNALISKIDGSKPEESFSLEQYGVDVIHNNILEFVTGIDLPYSYSPVSSIVQENTSSAVVDLCSMRPKYILRSGVSSKVTSRWLMQLWKLRNGNSYTLDCGLANAITLNDEIETISISSLFSTSSSHSEASKSLASMFFINKLGEHVRAGKMNYIVPDWANDFDLEGLRKSINFHFKEANPIPKSIAAVFAWQGSEQFKQSNVVENDLVLVVDVFEGGVSVTPIQAVYKKELAKIIPHTSGITWERHPTFIDENCCFNDTLVNELQRGGCPQAPQVMELFGLDGLDDDAGGLSIVNNDDWYHLPLSIRADLIKKIDNDILSKLNQNRFKEATNVNFDEVKKIFVLPVSNLLEKPNIQLSFKWLGSNFLPLNGGHKLCEWQELVEEKEPVKDIPLWRDHLPELSIKVIINGALGIFELVKDKTITPKRGRTINIPLDKIFTLPAGKKHYSFPLQMGKGNKESHFVAYLKSPAFPLNKDTECKLQMTYTYGADEPYELKFIALNPLDAGFKFIRVEWRSVTDEIPLELESLPIPSFPDRHSWEYFKHYPKQDGKSFSNLLYWCRDSLTQFMELDISLKDVDYREYAKRRKIGFFKRGATDKDNRYYCRVNVKGEDVFCHSADFIETVDVNSFYEECPIYLDVKKNKMRGNLVGKNISFSEKMPIQLIISQIKANQERARRLILNMRFHVLTIWNHEHSLTERDAPDDFRNAIHNALPKIVSTIEDENADESLKDELFFFLCCLHKDAPKIVSTRLLEYVKDNDHLLKYQRNIALAIGDAQLPYQQDLLKNIIERLDDKGRILSITLEIFSVVLWRSVDVLKKINSEQIQYICEKLIESIEFDLENIDKNIPVYLLEKDMKNGLSEFESENKRRGFKIATLCKHLELLLAMLRSRGLEGDEFKSILSPNKEITRNFVALVEKTSDMVCNKGIELRSRIKLQISKPDMYANMPDLLYALRMYLTGDNGANSIVLTSISDDE